MAGESKSSSPKKSDVPSNAGSIYLERPTLSKESNALDKPVIPNDQNKWDDEDIEYRDSMLPPDEEESTASNTKKTMKIAFSALTIATISFAALALILKYNYPETFKIIEDRSNKIWNIVKVKAAPIAACIACFFTVSTKLLDKLFIAEQANDAQANHEDELDEREQGSLSI